MSEFFNDTMQGLIETIAIDRGFVEIGEVPNIPNMFRVKENAYNTPTEKNDLLVASKH